jgi:predicted transcriptional regulator
MEREYYYLNQPRKIDFVRDFHKSKTHMINYIFNISNEFLYKRQMIVVAENEFTLEGDDFKMGEVEYEMVELLRRLNINRPVALTLACLSKGEEISSQCIEMVSGLRQPEVSIAMRYLRENDWVYIREEKKNQGKGRPVKLYKLTVRMETIIDSIEENVMAESRTVLQNIERLKSLS